MSQSVGYIRSQLIEEKNFVKKSYFPRLVA
jgi:hypothetical protein